MSRSPLPVAQLCLCERQPIFPGPYEVTGGLFGAPFRTRDFFVHTLCVVSPAPAMRREGGWADSPLPRRSIRRRPACFAAASRKEQSSTLQASRPRPRCLSAFLAQATQTQGRNQFYSPPFLISVTVPTMPRSDCYSWHQRPFINWPLPTSLSLSPAGPQDPCPAPQPPSVAPY